MNTLSRLDSYVSSILIPPSPKRAPSGSPKAVSSVPPPIPRLSNLPPTPRKRQRSYRRSSAQGPSIKLPPPTTPFLLRILLALWSILLSFWRSLVGETRAERTRRKKKRSGTTGRGVRDGVAAGVSSDDGSGSEAEVEPSEGEGEGWVDPVTRAPQRVGVDEPDDTTQTSPSRGPDSTFSFRLRSAEKRGSISIDVFEPPPIPESKGFHRTETPPSILSNPMQQPRQPRLLPNPMSTSLLDPSVPAIPASQTVTSLAPQSAHSAARPHQSPFHLQKTLILDLDETLIHSTSRPLSYAASAGGGLLGLSFGGLLGGRKSRKEGHTVEVVLNGRSTTYHVYKRPHVDQFLKKVASWYTLVIFTASMPEYADPVIEWLDGGRGLFAKKLYRESCHLQLNGSYVKDLALVEADLSRVCFMDNSPVSYNWNKANALPIEGWTSDPNDEALLQSIPVLDSLRFVNDVRRVLGIRGFS